VNSKGHELILIQLEGFYTLRGYEWHFLIETMPEASGASSRWLRSPNDDATGRQRGKILPRQVCNSIFVWKSGGVTSLKTPATGCIVSVVGNLMSCIFRNDSPNREPETSGGLAN
jgi:hypothetical protein